MSIGGLFLSNRLHDFPRCLNRSKDQIDISRALSRSRKEEASLAASVMDARSRRVSRGRGKEVEDRRSLARANRRDARRPRVSGSSLQTPYLS